MEKYENEKGVWRTIKGRRVFIRSGESLGSAMARSGKFKENGNLPKRDTLNSAKAEESLRKIKNNKKADKNIHSWKKRFATENTIKNRGAEQAEKNRINENAKAEGGGTRIQRNWDRYSHTDRREITHETLQKELANYKAKKQSNNKINVSKLSNEEYNKLLKEKSDRYKNASFEDKEKYRKELNDFQNERLMIKERERLNKQSNNKVESEYELYKRAKEHPESIDPMTENSTDWEALDEKYGKDYAVEKAQQRKSEFKKLVDESNKKKETIKNYVEKKKSNNKVNTNSIIERSGKVNQKTLKSYADDGIATDITRYSDKDIDKLEKKHGRLTHLKTSMGTYGMNGALLKSEKTGEYFVITARNGNLFRLV